MSHRPETIQATAVGWNSKGLLLTGASGSGKSTLALEMIGLGATLVADDKVTLTPQPDGAIWMSTPESTRGLIEARGVGVLCLPECGAYAHSVVDLDQVEGERLPDARSIGIAGTNLPLLYRVECAAFASILMAYLKGQRQTP